MSPRSWAGVALAGALLRIGGPCRGLAVPADQGHQPFCGRERFGHVGRVVLERLATARSAESFGKFVKNDRASTVQLAKDAHIEPLD